MNMTSSLSAAAIAVITLVLAGCGERAASQNGRLISFESAPPPGGPSEADALAAYERVIRENYGTLKNSEDIRVGAVRYGNIVFPVPVDDYFVCAQHYQSGLPAGNGRQQALILLRQYDGKPEWKPGLVKTSESSKWEEFCLGADI